MSHAEAETLAAFADGALKGEELASVSEHLQTCEECRDMVREAVMFEHEEMKEKPTRKGKPMAVWIPIAASVAVAVIGAAVFLPGYLHKRTLANDRNSVFASYIRPGYGRFSDEQIHREYSAMRGGSDEVKAPAEESRQDAATKLEEDARDDDSPAGRRALAIALVAQNKTADAVEILKRIPPEARDAAVWNDIAAAYLANGKSKEALAAVNGALKQQPKMPEALFTKAMILHDIGRDDAEEKRAWQAYLSVDSASSWAKEAREKIRSIE